MSSARQTNRLIPALQRWPATAAAVEVEVAGEADEAVAAAVAVADVVAVAAGPAATVPLSEADVATERRVRGRVVGGLGFKLQGYWVS